jgi:hypothetical protein
MVLLLAVNPEINGISGLPKIYPKSKRPATNEVKRGEYKERSFTFPILTASAV